MYLEKARNTAETMLSPAQVAAIFDDPDNPNPFAGKNSLELHLIRPNEALPIGDLEFRPFVMSQLMEMGREAAEQVL